MPWRTIAAWLLWAGQACCLEEDDQHEIDRFTITIMGIYIRCRGVDHYFRVEPFQPRKG